jgi:PKD repeat protein
MLMLAIGAVPVHARAQDQAAQGSGGGNGNGVSGESQPSGGIQIPNVPRITVQALPGYGPAPLTVGFLVMNANPDSAPLVSYRWTFGDGQISTLPPTVLFHSYTSPGTYTVTVTATTADGESATGFAGVTVTQAAN